MGSNPLKNSSELKAPSHPKQIHGPTAKAATFQHTPSSSASLMATTDRRSGSACHPGNEASLNSYPLIQNQNGPYTKEGVIAC
ncbi:hypothetical protein ACLOJK_015079, partial [Asimina triloba]